MLEWMIRGDVSIQYQVLRDLLGESRVELRDRITSEGWGSRFLANRNEDGHWGKGFYQPKWTSTHYTLLDLKNLELYPSDSIRCTIMDVLENHTGVDGGVNPSKTINDSDVCINGMFLNYASYFGVPQSSLRSVIDFLIGVQMPDGGFNCESNRGGAVHSSLHSTISVLEGFYEYRKQGYSYRVDELVGIEGEAREFILQHRLYRSDHTGEVIDKRMLMLSYPSRWRYDILRALDYFQSSGTEYGSRMSDALEVLLKKRRRDGRWPVQARHPGRTHFEMEKPGKPSRWNTLRAIRVLRHYDIT
ncbi:hypothetical protein GF326_09010 [Candidatus Bathyarchaeota archaeon]|nr:hypothetical protein [Candidatus Bathyarchaeota archaeon]